MNVFIMQIDYMKISCKVDVYICRTNFAKQMEQNLHERTNWWIKYEKQLFSMNLEVRDTKVSNIFARPICWVHWGCPKGATPCTWILSRIYVLPMERGAAPLPLEFVLCSNKLYPYYRIYLQCDRMCYIHSATLG